MEAQNDSATDSRATNRSASCDRNHTEFKGDRRTMNLTRAKAGHYIYGAYTIKRHISDEGTTWTVRHDDGEVWQVENLSKARELLLLKTGEQQ